MTSQSRVQTNRSWKGHWMQLHVYSNIVACLHGYIRSNSKCKCPWPCSVAPKPNSLINVCMYMYLVCNFSYTHRTCVYYTASGSMQLQRARWSCQNHHRTWGRFTSVYWGVKPHCPPHSQLHGFVTCDSEIWFLRTYISSYRWKQMKAEQISYCSIRGVMLLRYK